jgi:hypothetical protein
MSGYDDLTPAQLADCLDMVSQFPGNTGALSMLDEATLEYGWRNDSIGPARRAFADARHAHMRSYRAERGDYAPEAWDNAVTAAHALAAALRPLGDAILPRCKRQGPCGTCNMALKDGECRSSLGHVDEPVSAVSLPVPRDTTDAAKEQDR